MSSCLSKHRDPDIFISLTALEILYQSFESTVWRGHDTQEKWVLDNAQSILKWSSYARQSYSKSLQVPF